VTGGSRTNCSTTWLASLPRASSDPVGLPWVAGCPVQTEPHGRSVPRYYSDAVLVLSTAEWQEDQRGADRAHQREEKQAHGRGRSLLVEAEPVGDRGGFPATGDPELGQDP
jgi:hypothetical protein